MGQIREEFILVDSFSAAFSKFLNMGQAAENKLGDIGKSNMELGKTSEYAAQQMESMKDALSAQQMLQAATEQKLLNQKKRVEELQATYEKLKESKGAEANATLSASQALARAQIAEQKILQQSIKTSQALAKQNEEIQEFALKMSEAERNTRRAGNSQKRHKESVEATTRSATDLLSVARRIAATIAGIKLVGNMVNLSDTMVQTDARLNMVNDGLQTTEELNRMIYQSAQRSRSVYMEMAGTVAKLGQNAKDTFANNAETIQFAENLNKMFKIAGSSQQEISSATLQLTQGLGAGVLRGEELNSVFEAAPNIIHTIADYLDVNTGKIREMASEGMLTAEVVKNAMLSATDEINRDFAELPMTYSDAWTMIKNAGVNALGEVGKKMNVFLQTDTGQRTIEGLIGSFEVLSSVASGTIDLLTAGADFVVENWDYVYPVILGLGAAFVAAGVAGTSSALATAAAWAVANWPILAIGAAVAGWIFVLKQAGVSWQQMGEVAGAVLGGLYAYAYTVVSYWWNLFASFAEFFANAFNDLGAAVGHLFFDLFDNILHLVETVAGAIDALLNTNMSGAVAGFRGQLGSWVDDTFGKNAVEIKRMASLDVAETIRYGSELGGEFGSKMDNMNVSLEELTGGIGDLTGMLGDIPSYGQLGDIGKVGSVGSVKNVEGEIKMSDEDQRLYRDLAEQRYLNRIELKTLAPNIHVTLPEGSGGRLSAGDVADEIRRMLIHEMNSSGAISHG